MMTTPRGDAQSDAVLTAYLDNELEPEAHAEVERLARTDPWIRDRLARLAAGARGVGSALDHLLEAAPRERLESMLDAAATRSRPRGLMTGDFQTRRGLMAMAASLLLVIGGAAGFMIGRDPPPFVAQMFGWDEWQETIARQVSLYSPAPLAAIEADPVDQRTRLDGAGAALNLDLPASKVSLPGLSLKRVEQLQMDGRPLTQLLYTSDDLGVVALCIVKEAERGSKQETRRIAGMNLVYWNTGAHGFILVGRAPAGKLQELAETAARQFSG